MSQRQVAQHLACDRSLGTHDPTGRSRCRSHAQVPNEAPRVTRPPRTPACNGGAGGRALATRSLLHNTALPPEFSSETHRQDIP